MTWSSDRSIAVILAAIGTIYLLITYQLPSFGFAIVDSDVLPKGLGFLLVILSVLLFIGAKPDTDEDKKRRSVSREDLIVLGTIVGTIAIYIALLEPLGFLIATILFLIASPYILGYRHHIRIFAVSIIFSSIIYYSFTSLLGISLPQGIVPF